MYPGGLYTITGLLDSVLKKNDFSTFGQLVVANVTLNVKYAGEPVYLALSLDIIAIV